MLAWVFFTQFYCYQLFVIVINWRFCGLSQHFTTLSLEQDLWEVNNPPTFLNVCEGNVEFASSEEYWLPNPFASFPFNPLRASPNAIIYQLKSTPVERSLASVTVGSKPSVINVTVNFHPRNIKWHVRGVGYRDLWVCNPVSGKEQQPNTSK